MKTALLFILTGCPYKVVYGNFILAIPFNRLHSGRDLAGTKPRSCYEAYRSGVKIAPVLSPLFLMLQGLVCMRFWWLPVWLL